MRHFLDVDELSASELVDVLDLADPRATKPVLAGQGMALIFEKPSARTRNATEMAVFQLGGHPVTIRGDEIGFGVRETVEDVVRALACYHAALGARVFEHGTLERMAAVGAIPVVNLLSDFAHPCQALADLLTLRQRWGSLEGHTVAWVGDANNVLRSLALGAALSGVRIKAACPPGYGPTEALSDAVKALGGDLVTADSPQDAVMGADAVCTDVWTSMGQEEEASARRAAFVGYTIDAKLMAEAAPDAVFLHCLPAHRGEEVAAEVIDGPQSAVWAQAANRMHAVRGLIGWLIEDTVTLAKRQ